MRASEGLISSVSLARSNPAFASTVATSATSPGSTKGTNTVLPRSCPASGASRARPSPPYTSFSMVICKGAFNRRARRGRREIVYVRRSGAGPRGSGPRSRHIEQAQPRQLVLLEQALVGVLPHELLD